MRRVVITSLGGVSPIGNTPEAIWQSIFEKACGIDEISRFDTTEYRVKLAGEVKNLDMEAYFSKRDLKFNDRFTQFARIVAQQALKNLSFVDPSRVGVIIGSGIGGIQAISDAQDQLVQRGPSRVSPFFIPMSLINLAAGQVAIDHGLQGTCTSVVTACAAGTDAIGTAFHKIRDGYLDACLAGGSEASITPLAVAGFMQMKALSTASDKHRASIPFDKERDGFVMGEGAAVLLLEELEHAKKRNATILAEIVGYGNSCDAFHITAPQSEGLGAVQAIQMALQDAKLSAQDIDYVNAHGTSTPLNDQTETLALRKVFSDMSSVKVSSTKSYTGHLLGASGALEALICVQALQNNLIPATINHRVDDEACNFNVVKNDHLHQPLNYAMSNSLGFGGHNASIIFKKWEENHDL